MRGAADLIVAVILVAVVVVVGLAMLHLVVGYISEGRVRASVENFVTRVSLDTVVWLEYTNSSGSAVSWFIGLRSISGEVHHYSVLVLNGTLPVSVDVEVYNVSGSPAPVHTITVPASHIVIRGDQGYAPLSAFVSGHVGLKRFSAGGMPVLVKISYAGSVSSGLLLVVLADVPGYTDYYEVYRLRLPPP